MIRSRKVRYGGMTVLLTVLLITTVVLFNALFSSLATRYEWYVSMNAKPDYSVTESCYSLLGSVLEGKDAKIKLIFCDTEKNLKADSTSSYVYNTAKSLAERFPQNLELEFHNIWLNPTSVEQYRQTLDPATGEQVETALKSTNVIIDTVGEEYYRVYDLTEFFVFRNGDTSQLWAYNGEKKLAAGILHAVDSDGAVVGMTKNHGEIFYDYELLYLLDDAGYSLRYFDLYTEAIPENCNLIISYNPNSDLTVNDGVSEKSEINILNEFLSVSGNSFLLFLENGTPGLPNFDRFLNEWGVDCRYETSGTRSFRYMVQDSTQSLTSDGYTIYGEPMGAQTSAGLKRNPVFKNATSLRAFTGFVEGEDGVYTKGNRTMRGLYRAGENATSWANGKIVDVSEAILFSVTEQTNADGKCSRVGVCASVDFATEEFLQSAVHGNSDALLSVFEMFGKTNTPTGLTIKPFSSTTISTVTTSQMWSWTVVLALVPAVTVTAAAVLILVRRRNA